MTKPNANDMKLWRTLNDFGRPMHLEELAAAVFSDRREVQKSLHRLVCGGFLIASNSAKGVWVILNEREWLKGLWDLDTKMAEMRERRGGLCEAGRKQGWKEPSDPPQFNFEGGQARDHSQK